MVRAEYEERGTVQGQVLHKAVSAALKQRASHVAITDEQLAALCGGRDVEALDALGGVPAVLRLVDVVPAKGLGSVEVAQRRERFGANTFPEPPARSFFSFLWDAAQDIPMLVLAVAAGLSFVELITDRTSGWHDGVAILIAISLCIFVSSWNDYSQSLQFRALNADKRNITVQVLREGRRQGVSVFDLVVGDIAVLATGDHIPADGLLLDGQAVVVDESAMTGESDPMKKNPSSKPFMLAGCKVMEGYGTMVVTAVGLNTEWGRIMAVTSEDNDEETPLQQRLDNVVTGIGKVGTAVAVGVFVVLFAREMATGSGKWYNHLIGSFIVGVTIIVVAVPEGLPLAVTLALAYSMKKMMADKALVRHLSACETMGGATAICSDKTGTLTTNRMTVVRLWACGQHSAVAKEAAPGDVPSAVRDTFIQACFTNTTGAVSPGRDGSATLDVSGPPTEQALLRFAASLPGPDFEQVRAGCPVLHMEPFNSAKKTMAVAVRLPSGAVRVFWKGASEIVLAACTSMLADNGTTAQLSQALRESLVEGIDMYARGALRTLVLAYADLPSEPASWDGFSLPFEKLTIVALVGIKDPCRPGVPEAVAACQAAGIVVRMVTGDNLVTAVAIAKECGIFDEAAGHVALEGPVFRALPRAELLDVLPRMRVLARSSPTDKHTLVSTLRSLGEVVAVTGDGTNDAPALHEADIGLAMGISGTEVAKEASDIIILDDNFASCVRVVRWGRSVYRNIQAFIQFQLTVNVVALALNMICSLVVGDVPLTAVQLLWVNMIMDTMGALALATEPPRDALMLRKPYGRSEPIISNIMWRNLLLTAAVQLVVLFTLFFRGCQLLSFSTSNLLHYLPGVNATNPCAGHPTLPYLATPAPNGSVTCYDRSHGCPADRDVDGVRFTMKDRLKFQDYNTLTTTVFNAFVFMQIFNEINARNMEELNVFKGLFTNRIFMGVLLFTGGAQFIIIQLAGDFAQTTPLRWQHWIISVIIGLAMFPVAFIIKLIPVPVSPPLADFLKQHVWCCARSRVSTENDHASDGEANGNGEEEPTDNAAMAV